MPEINVEQAIDFLRWLGQPRISIYTLPHTGGVPQLRGAKASTLKLILEEYHNTYYSLALVKPGVQEKANKDELVSTQFLHVDLDPRDGSDPAVELTRLFSSVTDDRPKQVPAPSAIVMSGRGVQALWKLKAPLPLPEYQNAVESANKWLLECLIGPPGTWNVDRILRLPGSWNCLDAKKVAKGFQPQIVSLFEKNDLAYTLDDFGKWEPSKSPVSSSSGTSTTSTGSASEITANIEYTEDLSELTQYEANPDRPKLTRVRWLINNGMPANDLAEYEELHGPVKGRKANDRSAWVYDVACNLVRAGVPDGKILGLLTDPRWAISAHCRDQADPEYAARRQLARAKNTVAKDEPRPSPDSEDSGDGRSGKKKERKSKDDDDEEGPTPLELAGWLLQARKTGIVRVNAEWWTRDHHAYRVLEDEGVRKEVYEKFDTFDSRAVSRVVDALKAHPNVYRDKALFRTPCWLDGRKGPDPLGLIVVKNGFVEIDTGKLLPFDDQFYTTCQLNFDFDPLSPTPVNWIKFLDSVWPDDPQSIESLQMWFGYCLTQDTSLQKFMNIVGPKRSGKGTIAFVLGELIGENNRCGPSLNDLGQDDFALWAWVGKQLAIVSEVRIGKNADRERILERLLQVVGEDFLSIRRKTIANWEGKLNTRIMVLSNSVMNLQDEAGALVSRMLVLTTTRTFEGEKQDTHLKDKLRAELPSILLWALEGLRKLRAAGKITQPESARIALQDTIDATTPMQHPWEDILAAMLGNTWGKILVADTWLLLGNGAARDKKSTAKLTEAMKKIGWRHSRQRYNGVSQYCYLKDLNEEGLPFIDALQGRWVKVEKTKDNRYVADYDGARREADEMAYL